MYVLKHIILYIVKNKLLTLYYTILFDSTQRSQRDHYHRLTTTE